MGSTWTWSATPRARSAVMRVKTQFRWRDGAEAVEEVYTSVLSRAPQLEPHRLRIVGEVRA